MKVIDAVKMPGFAQWCPDFVKRVISSARLRIDGKEIDTAEIVRIGLKQIYVSVGGVPFVIKIWSFIGIEENEATKMCTEKLKYTLFYAGESFPPLCGIAPVGCEPIHSGYIRIKSSYDEAVYQEEVETYNKLHGVA